MVMVGGKKVGGYLSLMGGFLLHLTLGTLYCFGNMNTYMTSYLRTHVKGQVRALLICILLNTIKMILCINVKVIKI